MSQLNSLLEAWGDMWELHKGAEKNSKLDQYLRSGPNTGLQVLTTLSAISYTFANARELEKRYGLEIMQKPAVWYLFTPVAPFNVHKYHRVSKIWKSIRS